MVSASDFLTGYQVAVSWKYKEHVIGEWEHKRWTVTVTNDVGRSETFPYRTGMAIEAPTAEDVIYSLASDCRLFENHHNPHGLMREFGMTDYRKAEKIYDACNKSNTIMFDFCHSDAMFQDFLAIEDE